MQKSTKELKIIKTDELVPYINNSRTHSKKQIEKIRSSLREFGFINPVLIDKNNTVIAGHGRLMAAKEEGIDEIPCVLVEHLTEAQKKAYIIADNRLAEDAGWDEEMLKVEIEALREMEVDLEITGLTDLEIEKYLKDEDPESLEDNFGVSEALEKAAFVERGDIWTVGRHTLMCGDATSKEDVDRLMGGRKLI